VVQGDEEEGGERQKERGRRRRGVGQRRLRYEGRKESKKKNKTLIFYS
jgi:hypothetical protein